MAVVMDGMRTVISLTGAGVTFFEKSVTPPGIDGGDANDTTTMRNSVWRTRAPRKLVTMTPLTAKVAYDPALYNTILAQINLNQQISVTFLQGGTYAGILAGGTLTFWGFLRSFTPDDNTEGAQPTATITIEPSNMNASGVETAPTYA